VTRAYHSLCVVEKLGHDLADKNLRVPRRFVTAETDIAKAIVALL
jgi:hypothetical protein